MSAQPKVSLDHERAKLSRTTVLAIVVDSDGEGRWQALGVQDSDGIVAAVDPVLETDRG